jgi:integrase
MAAANLTEAQLRKLVCPEGRGEFIHTELAESGLALKCRSTGSRTWIAWPRLEGKRIWLSYGSPDRDSPLDGLGVPFRDALRALDQDLARIQLGIDPRTDRPALDDGKGLTVAKLLDSYYLNGLEHGRNSRGQPLRRSYIEKTQRQLDASAREAWGARPAASITAKDVSALLDRYNDRPAMQAAIQDKLGILFNYGKARGEVLANPCDGLPARGARGEASESKRFLSSGELVRVYPELLSIGYPGGHALALILLTGRRPDEVFSAEWSEFDLGKGLWMLPAERSKANNGKGHLIPLSAKALEILRDAATRKVGEKRFVFHRDDAYEPIDNIRADVRRANDAGADVAAKSLDPEQRVPWTPHDLRRTASTHMEMLGTSDALISAALNHSSKGKRGVTAVYARMLSDPQFRMRALREAFAKIADHYERCARMGAYLAARKERSERNAPPAAQGIAEHASGIREQV